MAKARATPVDEPARRLKVEQIPASEVDENEIPADIQVIGKLIISKKWTDSRGTNLLVASIDRKEIKRPGESGSDESAYLYVAQYLMDSSSTKLWSIKDYERECEFDLTMEISKNGLTITDLDKDGLSETTLVYVYTCTSDVSPANMKLFMHENTTRYALRGYTLPPPWDSNDMNDFEPNLSKIDTNAADYNEHTAIAGRYQNENGFRVAPASFLAHARYLWKENIKREAGLQSIEYGL